MKRIAQYRFYSTKCYVGFMSVALAVAVAVAVAVVLFSTQVFAQQQTPRQGQTVGSEQDENRTLLTLHDALSIALEKNFDIRLVANDLAMAANDVSWGNAGMLPRISGDVSAAAGVQNTTQTLLSGETRSLRGAENQSLSYGVNLQWTLFDGFQMQTRYQQLKKLEERGEVNWKSEVLNTIYAVYTQYFELVRQKNLIQATKTALDLSRFRYTTAANRYEIGRAAKLEVLNAQVDLNSDTTSLLNLKKDYQNAQVLLNELLGRELEIAFDVVDSISVEGTLQLAALEASAKELNPSVQLAVLDLNLARLESKRIRGQRYPVIDFNTAYTRTRSHSALGFSTESRGNGLNAGLSANINIFNGFNQRRNERNAALAVESAALVLEQTERNIQTLLLTAYRSYLTQEELVRLETRNLSLAKENLDITMEKFKLGSIAPVEFREAQRNFVDASTRHSTALLEYKLAETTLKQIAGIL